MKDSSSLKATADTLNTEDVSCHPESYLPSGSPSLYTGGKHHLDLYLLFAAQSNNVLQPLLILQAKRPKHTFIVASNVNSDDQDGNRL